WVYFRRSFEGGEGRFAILPLTLTTAKLKKLADFGGWAEVHRVGNPQKLVLHDCKIVELYSQPGRQSALIGCVMGQNSSDADWLKLPTFGALLNQKIVILSNSSDYVAVDQYFFNDCLRPLIDKIQLDEQWYLQKYPDVRQAIARKAVKDARDHFVRFGYFEHRLPYQIKVE